MVFRDGNGGPADQYLVFISEYTITRHAQGPPTFQGPDEFTEMTSVYLSHVPAGNARVTTWDGQGQNPNGIPKLIENPGANHEAELIAIHWELQD